MGLANLVPGISGGTMLLAAGIYPQFISSVTNFTRFKFSKQTLGILLSVGISAALAILTLAGALKELVINHRWIMYSLFIGLTLGGVPLLWQLIKNRAKSMYVWVGFGILLMIAVAWMQSTNGSGSHASSGIFMMFLAGVAGASAMILPGVSGGYLLLILGVYVPILTGIDTLKIGLSARDWSTVIEVVSTVVLPVGVGVAAGIAGVSNILKKILDRFESQTYAFLLGVLLGAVFGLWPFHSTVPLQDVSMVKGQTVEIQEGELIYSNSQKKVKLKDIPTVSSLPSATEGAGAAALIVVGFLVTMGVSRLGNKKESAPSQN